MILSHNGFITIILQSMGRDFLERFPPHPSKGYGRSVHREGDDVVYRFVNHLYDKVKTNETRATLCSSEAPTNTSGSGLRRVWEIDDEPVHDLDGSS